MKKGLPQILALSALLLNSKLPSDKLGSELNPSQYKPFSFTEQIMSNDILRQNQKEFSVEGVGYAGVGISVNSMIKQFLPYLDKPTFTIDKGFELNLTPNLSLEAACNPFNHIQLENSQAQCGIYLKFHLK